MKYQNLIIDGPYLAHRSFDSPYALTTSLGVNSKLIHGFVRSLNSLRKKFQPNKITVTWESYGTPSWRRDLQPNYKPSKGTNKDFISQTKDLWILLNLLGVEQYYSPTNEADDVIGTLCQTSKPTLIFTVDKDIGQVVTNTCHIFHSLTKKILKPNNIKEKMLVEPNQIPDLLAIMGDKADNIIGITNYGFKKSSELLKKYGSVENIPNDDPIYNYIRQIKSNKQLTLLNCNCELKEIENKSKHTIISILDKYELKKMKENINEYKQLGKKSSIEEFF